MKDVRIQPLENVAAGEATALLKEVMGDAHGREKSNALWEWKHQANPMGRSLGYAAYSPAGDLIALRPFMRWALQKGDGARVDAARALDTVVHPDWRRGGIFSRLTTDGLDMLAREGFSLIFNTPNSNSGPGYRKMGWRLLGHPVIWFRLRREWRCSWVETDRNPVASLSLFDESSARKFAGLEPPAIRESALRVSKSAGYLRWRYGGHPNLTYHTVQSGDAWAIVRADRRAGRSGVALVDWWLRPGRRFAFAALVDEVLRQTDGAYVVAGPLLTSSERLAALRHGFIPVPWRNVQLATRPVSMDECEPVFRSRGSWRFTLGDLETF